MGTKVLVIGLDGATPELVERWVQSAKLPNLARMMQRGMYGTLRSTYPPISPAAWTSFATGYNPGKHGTFDFRNYDPRRYSCFADTIVDSSPMVGKTIWDLVGAAGDRVGVVTVPVTYPAWKVNGFMVSGYPTPDSARSFAYPAEVAERVPPLTENSAFFKSAPHSEVLKELIRVTHLRTDVSVDELRASDFGLFVMVIGATDRAHHDWWKFIDPDHPAYNASDAAIYGDYVLQVYQAADECIGKLLGVIDEHTTVFVMSDHGGMAHPQWYFNTNAWLRELGVLRSPRTTSARTRHLRAFARDLYRNRIRRLPNLEKIYRKMPHMLKTFATNLDSQAMLDLGGIEWGQTLAYRFPMYPPVEGIMINVVGRQPQGCVHPGAEYEALRERLLEAARALRDPSTGDLIVAEAHRREDIYHGDHLEMAPDLILVTRDCFKGGTSLESLISEVPLDVMTKLSGVHRLDGIVAAQGPHIRAHGVIERAGIMDIAPTILYVLGLPIPNDMDGKPLTDLFDDDFVQRTTAEYSERQTPDDVSSGPQGYSQDEEESVRIKLEALGYL